MTFGLSLIPSVDSLGENRKLAQAADAGGLDYIAIQDHAYNSEFLDVWTLITYLAAETERIVFFPDVADLQLRPPAMLAKSAASLSVLSRGRIVLGVGGGAFVDGIAGMSGVHRSKPEMVEYTDESLQVMRQALKGGAVSHRGGQLTVDYEAGPPAPVPIWLGSIGPRMLALTGRASDGWVTPLNIYLPPEEVTSRQAVIDEAARSAGRKPSDVRRVYNVVGEIGPPHRGQGLIAEAETWIDTVSDWSIDLGLDTFIFWPRRASLAQVELFAKEVVPGVRERVSERRAKS
jgi:alkanesulfonate monooxygenase SsuD/methylene tetrahydromethanopterin reductase-like flavin-dependent oxidoreductase (luciferase family)